MIRLVRRILAHQRTRYTRPRRQQRPRLAIPRRLFPLLEPVEDGAAVSEDEGEDAEEVECARGGEIGEDPGVLQGIQRMGNGTWAGHTFSVLKLNLSDRKNNTAVGMNTVYPVRSAILGRVATPKRKERTPHVVANKLTANAVNSHRSTPRSSRQGTSTRNGLTGTATRSTARSTNPELSSSSSVSEETSFSARSVSPMEENA